MTASTVTIDLTQVLIVGVPAWIAAVFAGLAMLRAHKNGKALRTPSGDPIGHVVERAQDLAALAVASTTGAKGPAVEDARRRLNGGDDAQLTELPHRETKGNS